MPKIKNHKLQSQAALKLVLRICVLLLLQLSSWEALAYFENNPPEEEKGFALYEAANELIKNGQYEQADSCLKLATNLIPSSAKDLVHKVSYSRATILYNVGDYDRAAIVLDSLLRIIQTEDEDFQADVKKLYGNVLVYLGQYAQAYNNQLNALEHYQRTGDNEKLASISFSIGNNFFYQKQYSLALTEFEQALMHWEELEKKKGIFFALGAIGSVHEHLGNLKEAIEYSDRALDMAIELELPDDIAWTTYNVGTIASSAGESEKAITYLEKAKDMAIETDNIPLLGYVLEGLTVANFRIENYDDALATLDESFAIAMGNKDAANIPGLYRLYSEIYFELGDDKQGREYVQKYVNLKDSLQTEELSSSIHSLEKDFELRELSRQKEIELLKKDAQLKNSRTLLGIAAVATIAMLFMFLFFFVKTKSKHDKEKNELLISTNKKILRQNEILKSSNRDLNQYAYIISHDLKEPLRNIGGFTSLLKRRMGKSMDEDTEQYMDFISRGVQQMNTLLSDLLEYSKIRKNTKRLQLVDANEVLQNVIESIALKIESTETQLTIASLPKIYIEPNQFYQILLNLISNSIKFVQGEIPKIEINCSTNETEHVFSVKDNGIGVDEAFKDKIFVVFQRLNNRGEFDGSGIGLSTCKKIVNSFGGEIWLESMPGVGSTFFFSIPKLPLEAAESNMVVEEFEILDDAQAN